MIRRCCAAGRAFVFLLLPFVFGLALTSVGSRPVAAQIPSDDRRAQTLQDRARTPQGRPSPRAAQPTALTSSASTVFTRAGVSLTGVTDGGIAVGDVDEENGSDLLVVGTTDQSRNSPSAALYLRQSDGTFERADANLDPILTGAAAIADVDGKNGPDLFITGTDENLDRTTTLYLQQSDGTFDPANRGLPSAVSSNATTIADVDGQHGPDVLLSRSGETTLYLQQSDGRFSAANVDTFLPPVDDGDYSVADVDGQNGPDLLITGNGRATLFLQQSDGTFDPANANLTGVTNSSTSIADVDGQNGPDVLIAGDTDGFGAGGESATLYLQQSDGSFSPADAGLNGVTKGATAIADVDGQNGPDLVVAGDTTAGFRNFGGESATLYLQQSDGSFSAADAGLTPVRGDASASMADVDQDSDPDLVLTGYGSFLGGESARLYVNRTAQSGTNRDPRFVQSISSTAQAAGTTLRTRFEVGDPDGDPLTIALAEGEAASGVSLTDAGNGTAEFTFAPQRNQVGETIDVSIEASDGNGGSGTMSFQLTVPEIVADAKAGLSGLFFGTASIADIDGQNGPDLLTAGSSAQNQYSSSLYRQQADGGFSEGDDPPFAISTGSSAIADVDTDGDPDLLVTGSRPSGGEATLHYQQSDGSFSSTFLAGRINRGSSSIADVDRDGNPDLLITGDGYTTLFRQQDDGTFTVANANLTGVVSGATAIADVDGQNGPDLLVTGDGNGLSNEGGATATLYLQQPDSSFAPANRNLAGVVGGNGSAAIANVDGRNGPDLLITGDQTPDSPGGESAVLYLQQSDGSFAEAGAGLTGVAGGSVSIADVDGQNGPDLLIVGDSTGYRDQGGESATLYLQQADGSFSPAGAGLVPVEGSAATAVADVNGDGTPDPLIVGETSQFANTSFGEPTAILYKNLVGDDLTPPAVPTGLTATGGPGEVTLRWDANTEDDLAEYRVYRSTAPLDSTASPFERTPLQTVSGGTTTVTDAQVEGGTTYYYRITAVDAPGNESEFSAEVQATPSVPLRVTGLQPESGTPGTAVRVNGTGFRPTASDNTVTFGTATATVDSATSTVVYTTVPSGAAGGPAEVTVSSGTEAATSAKRFDVVTGGTGSFVGGSADLTGVNEGSVSMADVDGQNGPDLLVAGLDSTGDRTATLYLQQADGSFSPARAGLTGVSNSSTSIADVDGRHGLDLLIAGERSGGTPTATLYLQQPDGSFAEAEAGLTGVGPGASSAIADVDGKNGPDLLIAGDTTGSFRSGGQSATLYLQQPDGSFTEAGAGLTGVGAGSSSAIADVDGTNGPDLLVTGVTADGTASTTLYLQQPDGRFSPAATALPDVSFGSPSIADVDGKNGLDLLITGQDEGLTPTATLYLQQPDGRFAPAEAGLTGVSDAATAIADLDGQNGPDLLVTGVPAGGTASAALYLQRADGSFVAARANLPGVFGGGTATADVDGDGDLDPLLSGLDGAGPTATLYENGGDARPPLPPTGLTAGAGPNAVRLRWTSPRNEDVDTYRLYRDTTAIDSAAGPDGLAPIDSTGADTTALADTAVTVGQTYHYRVTAVDTAANESGFSNEAQAVPAEALTVWPGDTDNSGRVDQGDALPLGIQWNLTGPPRDSTGCAFAGQSAPAWPTRAATYADANGDGVVDQGDVLCIGLNWARSHPLPTTAQRLYAGTAPRSSAAAERASSAPASTPRPAATGRLPPDAPASPSRSQSGAEPGAASSNSTTRAEGRLVLATPKVASDSTFEVTLRLRNVKRLLGVSAALHYDPARLSVEAVEPTDWLGTDALSQSRINEEAGTVGLALVQPHSAEPSGGAHRLARLRVTWNRRAGGPATLRLKHARVGLASGRLLRMDVDGRATVRPSPTTFELHGNAPNPVRRQTTIRYDLPDETDVRLVVYDVLGRRVRTLVDRTQEAGRKEVPLAADRLASGVYFYHLTAGEQAATGRMTVVR